MKAYTDLEQSKKLAEILSIESADMCFNISVRKNMPPLMVPYSRFDEFFNISPTPDFLIPCWSLAALRNCLPSGICIDDILYVFESHNTFDNMWVYEYKFEDISAPLYSKSSNEIDACVEMIIKLYEQKFI